MIIVQLYIIYEKNKVFSLSMHKGKVTIVNDPQ